MFEQSNIAFIVAAYSVSWLVILGYLARLIRKGSRARVEYDRMAAEHRGDSGA
jgi:CcmD family protein